MGKFEKILYFLIASFFIQISLASANIADEPSKYLYKPADTYCRLTSKVPESRSIVHPYNTEPIGGGKCKSARRYCTLTSPNNEHSSSTGQKFVPDIRHTGDTAFCDDQGKETFIGCNVPYAVNGDPDDPAAKLLNFDQKRLDQWPKGDYCESANYAKHGSDNKCVTPKKRKGELTFAGFRGAMNNEVYASTTEDSFSAFMNNDIFEADGNKSNVLLLIAEAQNLGLNGESTDNAKRMNLASLKDIREEFLDQGDALMIMTSDAMSSVPTHSVVLVGYEHQAGEDFNLEIADSTFGGMTKYLCHGKAGSFYCTYEGGDGARLLYYYDGLNDKTRSLRNELNELCRLPGIKTAGDLCSSRQPGDGIQKWIRENAAAFGKNFASLSSMGNCFGWSLTIMRFAYLANFVGESPSYPAKNCYSAIMGEGSTAFCTNNKVGCQVDWWTSFNFPLFGAEVSKEISFGLCASKYQYTAFGSGALEDSIAGTDAFQLLNYYGVKGLDSCRGEDRVKTLYSTFANSVPVELHYRASAKYSFGSDSSSAVQNNSAKEKTWAINSLWERLGNWFAAVLSGAPSCSANLTLPNKTLTFTYQNGYIFWHPARTATAADYAAIKGAGLLPEFQATVLAFMSDAVIKPGDNLVYYWEPGQSNPKTAYLDPFAADYLRTYGEKISTAGLTTACTPPVGGLPVRFQQFLKQVGAEDKFPTQTTTVTVNSQGPTGQPLAKEATSVVYAGTTLVGGDSKALPVTLTKPITLTASFTTTKNYPTLPDGKIVNRVFPVDEETVKGFDPGAP